MKHSGPAIAIVSLLAVAGCAYAATYAIDLFTKSSEEHAVRGDRLLASGEDAAAVRSYGKALLRDKKNVAARTNLAYAYFRMKRYADAAQVYTNVYRDTRRDPTLLLSAAQSFERAGSRDEAEAAYKEAIGDFSAEPAPLFELGRYYLREKRYREAEALMLQAKGRFGRYPDPYLLLAIVKMKEKRLSEAYGFCKKALELDPKNEGARAIFAVLEKERKDPAKDAWRSSEEEDERYSKAVSSLMNGNITLNRR